MSIQIRIRMLNLASSVQLFLANRIIPKEIKRRIQKRCKEKKRKKRKKKKKKKGKK